jgi:hypothetical protein
MYRHDYVLRLIERLGQVLRTLRDRLLQRQMTNDDIRDEIQEIAREAGLDLAFARRLDLGTLVTWLAPVPDAVDEDRVWLMAELLYVEALAARASGDDQQAAADGRRALALFARISPTWKPGTDLTSAGERVAELQVLLRDVSNPLKSALDDPGNVD